MIKKKFKIALLILLAVFLLIDLVWISRFISKKQIDDVSPQIYCEPNLIAKSDILMVIPIFKNVSIAQNKSWCSEILALNKTLGMHGVYHGYREFEIYRDSDYVNLGREEFKKCFGYYPILFEAPQVEMYSKNIPIVEDFGMKYLGYTNSIFHKVYHCSDTGKYSNKFVEII